jgi:hypothetical protein
MAPYVLDPHVGFSILSNSRGERERHEELGCALQGPASRPIRRALAGLEARVRRLGRAKAIERAEELVRWLDDRPDYVQGLVTIEGRDFDGDDPGDLRELAPELVGQESSADRGLEIETNERQDFADGSRVVEQPGNRGAA